MRIFYLLISLISCGSFAADDQGSPSSSSLNQVYTIPGQLQNSLNIFASHARDSRFNAVQKATYARLEFQVSALMQMLNSDANPKPEITCYKPSTNLDKAEKWGRIWFEDARIYAAHVLRKSMQEIDYEIRQKASVHAPIFKFMQPMSQTDACASQPVAPEITEPAITTSAILRSKSTKKRTVRPKKVLPIDPKQPKIMGFFVQEKPDMPSISSSSSIIVIDSDDGSSQSGLPEKKQRRS